MFGRASSVALTGGALTAAALLLAGSPAALAGSPTAVTSLVSRDSGAAGTVALGQEPSLNGDGRYVAFESEGNFGGLNPTGHHAVWLRDRSLGTTLLISRLDGANGAIADDGPPGGNNGSGGASVSADGRYVVFDSDAANLVTSSRTTRCTGSATAPSPDGSVGNVPGNTDDVFLRDTVAGTTTLISHVAGAATTPGNDFSSDPFISPDGSTITFTSSATDLTAEAQSNPNCQYQVVAYRVATDTATIISRASGPVLGATEANLTSDSRGAMSSNGNIIAFSSTATNLTADATASNEEVFVRDLTTNLTTLVSRANGIAGAEATNGCSHPTISLDGNLVAMSCEANNLAPGTSSGSEDIYIRNRSANTIALLSTETPGGTPSTGASSPVMSNDGSVVVYESDDTVVNGGSGPTQAVATDVATGVNSIISRASGASGAVGNNTSTDIAINTDGTVIGWESSATNLTADTPSAGNTSFAFVRGAAPVLATPTPTPTGIPVPTAGAAQPGGGWPATGLLAILGGLATILGVTAAGRRRGAPGTQRRVP